MTELSVLLPKNDLWGYLHIRGTPIIIHLVQECRKINVDDLSVTKPIYSYY